MEAYQIQRSESSLVSLPSLDEVDEMLNMQPRNEVSFICIRAAVSQIHAFIEQMKQRKHWSLCEDNDMTMQEGLKMIDLFRKY